MWVCNLCRKQQEILTKSGAWFYGSGPGQVRGVFEGGPQGKKAKLQDSSLYPYQGTSGDLTPASERSRPHGGILPRQASLDNGSVLRYPVSGDAPIDRLVLCVKKNKQLLSSRWVTLFFYDCVKSSGLFDSASQKKRTCIWCRGHNCLRALWHLHFVILSLHK